MSVRYGQTNQSLFVSRGLQSDAKLTRWTDLSIHGVQRRMISVDNFFVFLRLLFFAVLLLLCDLVHAHAVEAMYSLPEV